MELEICHQVKHEKTYLSLSFKRLEGLQSSWLRFLMSSRIILRVRQNPIDLLSVIQKNGEEGERVSLQSKEGRGKRNTKRKLDRYSCEKMMTEDFKFI